MKKKTDLDALPFFVTTSKHKKKVEYVMYIKGGYCLPNVTLLHRIYNSDNKACDFSLVH